MTHFLRTDAFDRWLRTLRDAAGKARILARLRSAEAGNFADVSSVGMGIFEMRIHTGPGYRVYYCRRSATTWVLLCGGDKSSQERDIRRARRLLDALERRS
ncbi:MAG: type II toxin-antitoxin system RelE/ParE family toxin [Gemmatimonadota bacterium]